MGPFLLYYIVYKNILMKARGNDTMKNTSIANCEVLKQQVVKIDDLTKATCEMCGGSYNENLNGATSYFNLNNEHFKITIEKI